MGQLGILQAIYRYPVKSMAGEELEKVFVGYGGIMGDRVYAFVRAKGIKGFPWHTGSTICATRPSAPESAFASKPFTSPKQCRAQYEEG
jgi:uncharacterized protein YcbX